LLAASGGRISGERFDSAQGAGFGEDVGAGIEIGEAIRKRAVDSSNREGFAEARAPRLFGGVAQQLNHRVRRNQILAGEAGAVVENILIGGYAGLIEKSAQHLEAAFDRTC